LKCTQNEIISSRYKERYRRTINFHKPDFEVRLAEFPDELDPLPEFVTEFPEAPFSLLLEVKLFSREELLVLYDEDELLTA